VAPHQTLKRRIGEELKACAWVAYESLTGIYRKKPKSHRRVLHFREDVEQCTSGLRWFPWYELTIDGDEQPVCKECTSLIGRW